MSKVVRTDLTADVLHELLDYDPDTGVFTWRVARQGRPFGYIPVGTEAGSIWADGYRHICIYGVTYPAARLAFLWMTGRWPSCEADHENRNRSDDTWTNLRDATGTQNQANKICSNASGFKGVCWEASRHKYKAAIEVAGKHINLGRFDLADEAHEAYAAAARKYYGEFGRSSA